MDEGWDSKKNMKFAYKNIPGCVSKKGIDFSSIKSFEDETLEIANSEIFQKDIIGRILCESEKLILDGMQCRNRKEFFSSVMANVAKNYNKLK